MKRGCAWPVLASLAWTLPACAETAEPARRTFDTRLLRSVHGSDVDLSRFERGDAIAPGMHALDVLRNGDTIGRHTIRFAADSAGERAAPCVDRALAEAIGLALSALSTQQRASLDDPARCVRVESLVSAARASFDGERLALQLSIPQAALVARVGDAVDPSLREAGIAAFRANHAWNVLHHHDLAHGKEHTQASARFELGANAMGWRWRHRSTHAWQSGGRVHSHTLSSTLERDLDAFDAQLTLGDFHTGGALFDSIGLRGVRIETDERMLPPSMRRPAPVVRGIAGTHARVQVRQDGVLLHDTTVAPGPFALRDLRPLGRGGALDVRVVEADGRVSTFSVPWVAIPGLLRAGQSRFSLAAGRWRDAPHAQVVQATLQRGLQDRLTAHGGAQLAPDYAQALGGLALSTRAGAFSLDRAQSRMAQGPRTLGGHALRIAYAGRLPGTGTMVDVAAWRHGSGGFRSLGEAMRPRTGASFAVREHTRTDASVRQAMGPLGTLTLGLVDRHWRAPRARQRTLRLGWGVTLPGHALLQATFDHVIDATRRDTTGTVSFAMPLATGAHARAMHAHARVADDGATLHASATGVFGRDRRHAWGGGVSQGTQRAGTVTSAHATLTTQGPSGRAGIGLSASRHARQWSATAEGSLVVHATGATFGQPLGDTIALVRAADAHGAALLHHATVRLDRSGRGIVPQLSPYRPNTVGLQPHGLSPDIAFDWTERSVVPRAGAVLDIVLPTTRAPLRRIRIMRANGHAAPFAADVRTPQGMSVGTVGRGGVALLRAATEATQFELHWRDAGHAMHCRFTLPPATGDAFADPIPDARCPE